MTKAIFWKEWKRSRWYLAAFLAAAVVIPALPTQFVPDEGATARMYIRALWYFFSLSTGWLFGEQSRLGSLPFLLARPAPKPSLFCIHYMAYLSMLAALIAATLSAHYIHMAFRFPGFSFFEILFEPELIFGLAICLLLFSFSLFIANSFITFGSARVMVTFLVLLTTLLILIFAVRADIPSISRLIRALAARLNIHSIFRLGPSFNPEDFSTYLLLACIGWGILFSTLSMWMISFFEMRDAKNRVWMGAVGSASLLCLLFMTLTANARATIFEEPPMTEFKQIFADRHQKSPTEGWERVIAFADDAVFAAYGSLIEPLEDKADDRSKRFHTGKKIGQSFARIQKKNMGERVYLSKTRIHRNNTGELVYLSDTLLWGENIRVHSGGRSETISPRDLSRKESFGLPFPSPDEDRIAYLRASRPRFGGKATTSLMITKLNAGSWSRSISDLAELPGDIETTTWEPIGWTPDGYDFMLRKSEGGKTEIWAVDWVAQGPHRFLEEYSDTIITSDDLPGNGEWLSLLKPAPGGKWNLELVNYRSGESVSLGIFEDRPVRTWADYGGQFIFWEPTGGLAIYATGEQIELVSTHPDFPSALEMKWTEKLTLVVADTAPPAATPRLIMLDPKTFSITPLVDNWRPGIDQWDWLDSQTLIYSDRDGLWLWRFYLDDGPKTLYSFASSGNSK